MSTSVEVQKEALQATDDLPPSSIKPLQKQEIITSLTDDLLADARFSSAFRAAALSPGQSINPSELLAENGISVLNTNAHDVDALAMRIKERLYIEETPDIFKDKKAEEAPGKQEDRRSRRHKRSAKEIIEDFWEREREREALRGPRIARMRLDPRVKPEKRDLQTDAEKGEIALLSALHGTAPQETARPHFEAQDAARNEASDNILNTPFSANPANTALRSIAHGARREARSLDRAA